MAAVAREKRRRSPPTINGMGYEQMGTAHLRSHCASFEGISLLTLPSPGGSQTLVHGLEPLHELVLSLLGPAVSKMYETSK